VNSRTFKDLWNEIQGLSSTCPVFKYFQGLEFRGKKFKYFQGLSRMRGNPVLLSCLTHSGFAQNGHARSNDLAGRSTALVQALAPPCLALRVALLR